MQEELYPPSAAPAREELDDARLVDLDVAEESPFLRAQKRVPARRGSLPKKTAHRLLWAFVAVTVLCVSVVAAGTLYHYGEHSWRFRIESSDNIEVAGMENATKAQIMEVEPIQPRSQRRRPPVVLEMGGLGIGAPRLAVGGS